MTATSLPVLVTGKVRSVLAVPDEAELVVVVASDRISAFDHVLPTEVPDKGAVLTALTLWWLEELAGLGPHHLVTADVADYPVGLRPYAAGLRGRSMLCRRLRMVPVECVARGYLTGSGLLDYRSTGAVCGHPLPPGLRDGDRLPEPIFTPATKAPAGEHDQNLTRADLAGRVGADLAAELERRTLEVYLQGSELAAARGILVADTKLELGHDAEGELRLGDEVLTPDSSRFWPADDWSPGRPQPSYDKQCVRDWLVASGWDRASPPPELPSDVVAATRARYVEAYERLTGRSFEAYLTSALTSA